MNKGTGEILVQGGLDYSVAANTLTLKVYGVTNLTSAKLGLDDDAKPWAKNVAVVGANAGTVIKSGDPLPSPEAGEERAGKYEVLIDDVKGTFHDNGTATKADDYYQFTLYIGAYLYSNFHFNGDVGGQNYSITGFFQNANPRIDIDKVTNGIDGGTYLKGSPITWTYTVTNTGNVPLANVKVTDNQSGVNPAYQSGDTNSDGKLDLKETWIYTATGTASGGEYANIGTVEGYYGSLKTTDSDRSWYFGADPNITINKVTNGKDGGTYLVGAPITWTYTVTNTGNVPLANVKVTDDQGITTVYQSGDTDGNQQLDQTETWTYTATGTARGGRYENVGTACGDALITNIGPYPVCHQDGSWYFGANPGIAITKTTNGGDGLQIQVGTAITWKYSVTNAGNVPLANVTVTDNKGVSPVYKSGDTDGDTLLDLTETWIYEAYGTATLGKYSNIGTADGSFTDDTNTTKQVTATDPSSYTGVRKFTGMVAPTDTDADMFVNGTATPVSAFDMQVSGGKITNVANPGQAFYFTTFTATATSLTIGIEQTSSSKTTVYPDDYDMNLTQVQLYKVGQFDSDPDIDTSLVLGYTVSTPDGDLSIKLDNLVVGQEYVLRIRIDPKSLVGKTDPGSNLVNNFTTSVDGVVVDGDPDGVMLKRIRK